MGSACCHSLLPLGPPQEVPGTSGPARCRQLSGNSKENVRSEGPLDCMAVRRQAPQKVPE